MVVLHELYFCLALIQIDDRKERYILAKMKITDLQLLLFFLEKQGNIDIGL